MSVRDEIAASIKRYYEGCNAAETDMIRATLTPDAVHYFPEGALIGPFIGANAIAESWCRSVQVNGSQWTIDDLVIDVDARKAVIEWTHFKDAKGTYLRGLELCLLSDDSRISEIRAYYAAPAPNDTENFKLGAYDYVGRGYPMSSSAPQRAESA